MSRAGHVADSEETAVQPAQRGGDATSEPLALVRLDDPAAAPRRVDAPLVIGRSPDCQIVVDGAAVSRRHALVTPTDGGVDVLDLDSRNGVFVDGRRLGANQMVLRRGRILRIGDAVFRVCCHEEAAASSGPASPLVGGAALAAVRRLITLVGPTDLSVLIRGETGTGKDVVARLLHAASRREGPCIALNCAALPEPLVEGELFGHVRGAFTGALTPKKGLIAAAEHGSVFLDEVGELPPLVQAKLLRVIEDHEVRPVGGKQAERIDVRIISATNRDLAADEAAGRFRGDLLARLSTVEIFLPPLREHVEDLPALLTHLCARAGLPGLTATPDALEAMALYAWPHNVRELDNLCKSVGLGGNAELTLERLPERISAGFHAARRESDVATLTTGPRATAPPQPPLHLGRAGSGSPDRGRARARAAATEPPPEAEPPPLLPGPRPDREAIVTALIAHGGNVRRASLDLGLARGHLYRLLRRFGVTPDDYRRGDTPLEAHAGPVLAFTRPSQDEP